MRDDAEAERRARRAAWMREYRKNNREKLLAQQRARYEKKMRNPEVLAAERAYRKEYNRAYHSTPAAKARKRARDLANKYGLTVRDFEAMATAQGNLCLLCGDRMTAPVVDHCHDTGQVRGLLCKDCNTGLGHFRDNISTLLNAVAYLEKHKALTSLVGRV